MVCKRKVAVLSIFVLLITNFSLFAQSADTSALDKRNKFIETAKQFLGVPYVYGGTSRSGIDCSGLVFLAGKGIGLSLPRTASQICDFSRKIEDSERQAGDLLFFSDNGSKVTHVSIYLGDGKMIHAASSGPKTGVIISEVTESYWKRTYYCAGRIIDPVTAVADNTPTPQTTPTTNNGGTSLGTVPSGGTVIASINKPEKETAPTVQKEESVQNEQTTIPMEGIVIATANKKVQDAKEAKETTEEESEKKINPFLEKISIDVSVVGGWSLFTTEKFGFVFRGLNAQGVASYGTGDTKPGVGLALNWDPSMNIFQLIFTLSFFANDNVRIYAGPVLTLGKTVLPGTSQRIEASVFPGILGVSLQTPVIHVGKFDFRFCQDIALTVYNKTDGSALPFGSAAAAGLSFQTGFRVTIPRF